MNIKEKEHRTHPSDMGKNGISISFNRIKTKRNGILLVVAVLAFASVFAVSYAGEEDRADAAKGEMFEDNGIWYEITKEDNGNNEAVVVDYTINTPGTILTIPDKVTNNGTIYKVTSIYYHAFQHCTSLTEVTIPDSVTSIGDEAFVGCYNLTSITIPDSVTSIGMSAFFGCYGLTTVTIPDSVTSIGNDAFMNCTSLTSVTIGNSVESIGVGAFSGCSSLTEVTIPDSVTSIGDYAFWYCSSLTSVTIPNSVKSIGDYAFADTNLTSVTITSNIDRGLGSVDILDKCFSDGDWKLPGTGSGIIKELIINTKDAIDIGGVFIPDDGSTLTISSISTNVTGKSGNVLYNGIAVEGKERAGKTYTGSEGRWIGYAEYSVSLSSSPSNGGSVYGSGVYDYHTSITIRAVPSDGYTFVKWSDGNTDERRSLLVTSDISLKAIFEKQEPIMYAISVNIEGKGTVYGAGTYEEGSIVTLYATASNGYEFSGWSYSGYNGQLISVVVGSDITITATFSELTSSLGGGSGNYDTTTVIIIVLIILIIFGAIVAISIVRGRRTS